MQATLLHGEGCTIWKNGLLRKILGYSKLSFRRFVSFSVRRGEEEPQFFKCSTKDILLGKYGIEKTKKEPEGGPEGGPEGKVKGKAA
jgi:hypothetical protein